MFSTNVFESFSSMKLLSNSTGNHIDMSVGQPYVQRNESFMAIRNTLRMKSAEDFKKRILIFVILSLSIQFWGF